MDKYIKIAIAEFVGTFLLVALCSGTAAIAGQTVASIALTFGFVLFLLIIIIGPLSGAHVNPAVSLAMFINKKITVTDLLVYVAAQLAGAMAAGLALFILYKMGIPTIRATLGANFLPSSGKYLARVASAGVVEFALTFIFVFVVLFATSLKKADKLTPALIISLTLVLVHIFGINITGTSVNPFRTLGPSFFAYKPKVFLDTWIFYVAPFVGAAAAAFAFQLTKKHLEVE